PGGETGHLIAWITSGSTKPLLIALADRESLLIANKSEHAARAKIAPDIVVLDDSFTNQGVPFGAFVARRGLLKRWNQRGTTTFHSTTYQPNTISSRHVIRCLEQRAPAFVAAIAPTLRRIESDPVYCREMFGRLYSALLAKLIHRTGFD